MERIPFLKECIGHTKGIGMNTVKLVTGKTYNEAEGKSRRSGLR